MRQEFSKKTRVLAFQRAGGVCENVDVDGHRCTVKLAAGWFTFDHTIPFEISGDSSLENCQCLCKLHDKKKTRKDQADIGKARRVHAKHIGARVTQRPMACGKNSPWKKKMSGEVVPR